MNLNPLKISGALMRNQTPSSLGRNRSRIGYGVLVVNGHLTVSGQGTWNGYIFCTEGAEFTGGGRPFHLYGAMILGAPSGADAKANFTCSGQTDLYYSQEMVEQASTNLRSAVFTYWSEL